MAVKAAQGLKGRWEYDWERYMDGEPWVLSPGQDYPPERKPDAVRQAAINWSLRHGVLIRTHVDYATGKLTVQAVGERDAR